MAHRAAFIIAFTLYITGFILGSIGFGTSYWFVGNGMNRKFVRLGLWEVCFNGFWLPSDYIGKEIYGCWWLYHKEFFYIRDWIMPGWFVAVQTLMTTALLMMFCTLVLFPVSAYRHHSIRLLNALCCLTFFTMLLIALAVVIFPIMTGEDRTWMPRPDIDSLSWSFALCVVSDFLCVLSWMSITIYTLMRRWENLPRDPDDLRMHSSYVQEHLQRMKQPLVQKM